jgi:hypothetical protein
MKDVSLLKRLNAFLGLGSVLNSPAGILDACRVNTLWNFRYPRLLGRIWYEDHPQKPSSRYPERRNIFASATALQTWLMDKGNFPFGTIWALPSNFNIEASTKLKTDFVLTNHRLILPVPPPPRADVKPEMLDQLADHGNGTVNCAERVSQQHWFQDHWAHVLTHTGANINTADVQASQEARRLSQETRAWAITSRTLAALEKAIAGAMRETDLSNYEALLNQKLQAASAAAFFHVRVDPGYQVPADIRPWHYQGVYSFEPGGVRVPQPPVGFRTNDVMERLVEASRRRVDDCPLQPCCP